MKFIARLMLLALFVTAIGLTMTACNTVVGAGKDIEAGGKAIQDTADDD